MRDRSDPAESRFLPLFQALAAAGIRACPAVYHDDFADEVEQQLQGMKVLLVWCNPIQDGRRRDVLDAMLLRVAASGTFVSAHPEAIMALGTKDVLLAVRGLPFGSDAHRVGSLAQLEDELPARLQGGARVLKQYRGHSGIGIWRVELADAASRRMRVRHAVRGAEEELIDMPALKQRLAPYFEEANGGHMIDQAWQPRLAEGMVRAYMVEDRVSGFGVQPVVALHPITPGEPPPQPTPRVYHGADHAPCQRLKRLLESQWVEMLRSRVDLPKDRLPLLWDCDFLLGEPDSRGDGYVLCEVNVSSVAPFPPESIPFIVEAVKRRLAPGGVYRSG